MYGHRLQHMAASNPGRMAHSKFHTPPSTSSSLQHLHNQIPSACIVTENDVLAASAPQNLVLGDVLSIRSLGFCSSVFPVQTQYRESGFLSCMWYPTYTFCQVCVRDLGTSFSEHCTHSSIPSLSDCTRGQKAPLQKAW